MRAGYLNRVWVRSGMNAVFIPKEVLVDLYWNQRKTPTEIAQIYGLKNGRTVRKKMEKFDIKRRTLSEAMTKKRKLPFTENSSEKAFLLGLRAGDFHAKWIKNCIRIQTSTTHPAQFDLLKRSLEKYGESRKYLYKNAPNGPEWFIYVDLHPSFEFLVKKPGLIPRWILNDDELFFSFLAAYMDCEGNWHVAKSHQKHVRFTFRLRTCDKQILEQIQRRLVQLGFHSRLYLDRERGTSLGYGTLTSDFYSLFIGQKVEVLELIHALLSFSRHYEKVDKMQHILNHSESKFDEFMQGWNSIRNKIIKEKVK